mmetsp:Transcript_30116/g.46682  ORF Transcript_30116/g.46682 Transcript_30116/m.46682 type:complete len:223 (-) Transcript_30116:460-1128(-)
MPSSSSSSPSSTDCAVTLGIPWSDFSLSFLDKEGEAPPLPLDVFLCIPIPGGGATPEGADLVPVNGAVGAGFEGKGGGHVGAAFPGRGGGPEGAGFDGRAGGSFPGTGGAGFVGRGGGAPFCSAPSSSLLMFPSLFLLSLLTVVIVLMIISSSLLSFLSSLLSLLLLSLLLSLLLPATEGPPSLSCPIVGLRMRIKDPFFLLGLSSSSFSSFSDPDRCVPKI